MYGYRTATPKERVDLKYSITVSGGHSVWTAGNRTIPMLFAACCITSIFFLIILSSSFVSTIQY